MPLYKLSSSPEGSRSESLMLRSSACWTIWTASAPKTGPVEGPERPNR
ncbi:hypothetical protein FOPG_19857 [Fusarium oxysporum f. sp. conglutinans race 2 54008]|uniref:Uncharacterized protein n=1 Tax=Fusarium oxysporum f. sp. conglutinans race 2 54008 TaxID=1089457 RepID=X0GVN8_FUSOX|nr:hypothetical protein FOPG_19857 [Fusarium oxysporum f. sp. conglutinans race 2 54008]